jgi:hypothetical protein
MDYHPLTVDVANSESDQFCPAHAGGVERHQHGSMKKIAGAVNETPDFIAAEDDRQSSPGFRVRELIRRKQPPESMDVKETNA